MHSSGEACRPINPHLGHVPRGTASAGLVTYARPFRPRPRRPDECGASSRSMLLEFPTKDLSKPIADQRTTFRSGIGSEKLYRCRYNSFSLRGKRVVSGDSFEKSPRADGCSAPGCGRKLSIPPKIRRV